VAVEEAPRVAEDPVDVVIARQNWLDPLAEWVQAAVGGFYGILGRPGFFLKDLAHGTKPLGHPLHPALTDVPLGAWSVMIAADLVAVMTHRVPFVAGDVALVVGILGALVAAVAGYTDFHETYGQERRVAVTHGLLMTVVLVAMVVSLIMRVSADSLRGAAIVISSVAWVAAVVGGYLGGHLTFRYGTMVNHNAFTAFPEDYVAVGTPADFTEGVMRKVDAAGTPVLVVRLDGRLHAIANVCSHAGGPLDEGKLAGDVVTCPWHGSRFCVRDGRVRGGPATFNQPVFTLREASGRVELKAAQAIH
jgi:nitrite reductase/ring-hydroxylating ferredoxin subunit/uncharacterized membrane protein